MSASPYDRSDRDLSARIARSAGSRAGYKQLVRELGLGGGRERRLLLEQLTRMVGRGELSLLAKDLWGLPKPPADLSSPETSDRSTLIPTRHGSQEPQATFSRGGRERLVSGRLELHRDGFGFVRPEPLRGTANQTRGEEDIFIPPNALHAAMHGDVVLVDEDPPARDGRRSGRIARVLTRRNPTVVGIFHYGQQHRRRPGRQDRNQSSLQEIRGNYVQPWDERLGGPIEIPPGAEGVQESGASPHRTLGEEALRSARSEQNSSDARSLERSEFNSTEKDSTRSRTSLEGLAVEVELTSYPSPSRLAVGRIVEVLGPPDAFGVDVEIVIRKHGIPHTFPAHVLAEAERRAEETVASLPTEELKKREDFRGLAIVTIDGESARDFDDAILVRSLENGNTELQVHIADVSHYVRNGSALDTEARVRGTSVYFPDRAVPMLPHALSSNMCSLVQNEDRLVQSCVMEIDARGEVVRYRVTEGIIRSVRRMTYTSVQQCLNASPEAVEWNKHGTVTPEPTAEDQLERERIALERPELPAAFDRMLELALRLNRKRVRRGSIDFDLPEPVVQFDPDGNMKAIVRSERGWSHRLIEEFMLSANECVATWLTAQGVPSIYRVHEMPDAKRIVEFEETAATFGQTLGIGALPVKRITMKSDRRESQRRSARGRDSQPARAQEMPERIPVTPQMYQRLIKRISGKPEERILSYLMLRSLKQARYAEKNDGHFALASPCYTHFTSPIRRYPDLIVHRLLRAMLHSGANPEGGAILSTDLQPWKTETSLAQGRHSAGPVPLPYTEGRLSSREPTAELAGVPVSTGRRARKPADRAGRIGWATEKVASTSTFTGEAQRALNEAQERALEQPISAEGLSDIAVESSQSERRAADAERELIEWKKMKFMADKIGDDFKGIILSVTKFGFFVELDELFIEGLVPLGSLIGDFYLFRDADRSICGSRTGHCFRVGDRVDVILDRIDRQQRRLQFALKPGTEPAVEQSGGPQRRGKSGAKKARAEAKRAKKANGRGKRRKKAN